MERNRAPFIRHPESRTPNGFRAEQSKKCAAERKKRKKTVEAVTNAEIFDAIWCPG